MLKATTLRLDNVVYKDLNNMAKKEYTDLSSFLRKLVMKSYINYKLQSSLKEWSEGKKSLGDVAKENNISIWTAMDEAKKRNISSAVTLEDIRKNSDFDL